MQEPDKYCDSDQIMKVLKKVNFEVVMAGHA